MPPRQLNRQIKNRFGQRNFQPQTCPSIILKVVVSPVSFGSRNSALKDLLCYSMSGLHAMERRQPDVRMLLHVALRFVQMCVCHVQRYKEARVRVSAQYRERLRSSITAFGKTRSPKIAFARAAKSGHSTGAFWGRSGTIRPMTRSLSRNSTVFPALSHAFRRRVSRSPRMLRVGILQMCHIMCHIVKGSFGLRALSMQPLPPLPQKVDNRRGRPP